MAEAPRAPLTSAQAAAKLEAIAQQMLDPNRPPYGTATLRDERDGVIRATIKSGETAGGFLVATVALVDGLRAEAAKGMNQGLMQRPTGQASFGHQLVLATSLAAGVLTQALRPGDPTETMADGVAALCSAGMGAAVGILLAADHPTSPDARLEREVLHLQDAAGLLGQVHALLTRAITERAHLPLMAMPMAVAARHVLGPLGPALLWHVEEGARLWSRFYAGEGGS